VTGVQTCALPIFQLARHAIAGSTLIEEFWRFVGEHVIFPDFLHDFFAGNAGPVFWVDDGAEVFPHKLRRDIPQLGYRFVQVQEAALFVEYVDNVGK
jgi:hypothetical protein